MELDTKQRALLASYVNTDGFIISCQLMKDEVLKFNQELLAQKKPDDVVIAHNRASVAAEIYEGFLNRVNAEVFEYTAMPKVGDKPIDSPPDY